MDKKTILDEIFANDPFNILVVKPVPYPVRNEEDRLVSSFNEIAAFYAEHGREPELGKGMQEMTLYSRLKGIRENPEKLGILLPHDKQGLLSVAKKEINSLEDILGDDSMGILDAGEDSIFNLKHVPKETTMPDYVAKRKPCKDFDSFEKLFTQCQSDLSIGKRKLYPFRNGQQIEKGYFFVLKGVLLYVAKVGKRKTENGSTNARLRVIFENGTESDMLLRSLSAELYKDGRRVTEHDEKLLDNFNDISADDHEAGFIYVLRSKSTDSKINSIENLYKIGYSEVAVEERVKYAESEPTYLMAPVTIVTAFKCYNLNPQKLEQLLHNFFGAACLNIDIFDKNGIRHSPREWFVAPLDIIEQSIEFIISGEIVEYKFDPEKQLIVGRK